MGTNCAQKKANNKAVADLPTKEKRNSVGVHCLAVVERKNSRILMAGVSLRNTSREKHTRNEAIRSSKPMYEHSSREGKGEMMWVSSILKEKYRKQNQISKTKRKSHFSTKIKFIKMLLSLELHEKRLWKMWLLQTAQQQLQPICQ